MTSAPRWKTGLLDGVLLFLLSGALIWPLFTIQYANNWGSIESTFIADARFLREHWPNPRWQPLWYGGTRFDYIYPPGLRYGTAGLSKLLSVDTARAYHIYTALLYSLGAVGVYLLIRVGSGSRGAAWLGAVASALLSPSFLFMTHMRTDAPRLAPVKWSALVRYGEGPHMSALTLIPFALAASYLAFQKRRPAALALAAVFSALVVAHNFYGGTALAVFYPLLVWAFWITHRERALWFRAAAIPLLAYGISAYWLVPSYFRITATNLEIVSEKGNVWSIWVALGVAAAFAATTWKLARGRPERAWPVFVWGGFVFFTLNVLGQYYVKFRVAGEPERLVPELDLVMILIAVEGLRRLWTRKSWIPRVCAAVVIIVALGTSKGYVRRAWTFYTRDPNFHQRVEYQITDWLANNAPDSRSAATGSLRFWFNAWHDLAQLGGGSEQGLLNPMIQPAHWELNLGPDPEHTILWMQCLGIDLIIVHYENSREFYHDYVHPHKFDGALPVIYNDGEGNVIFQVPRRYPGLARVIDNRVLATLVPMRFEREDLRAFADMVEKGPDAPTGTRFQGTDVLEIQATVQSGQSIVVQMSYDPAWRAYSTGRVIPIRRGVMGQMILEAPPGEHHIRLVFELPLENQIGRVLTALSATVLAGLFWLGIRRREASS